MVVKKEELVCPNCGQIMDSVERAFVCTECGIWMLPDKKGNEHYFLLHDGYELGECPNCEGCQAWEPDNGFNIPQAGMNACPVCGRSGWFVVNRCNVCDHEHCPAVLEDSIWAPGLALLEVSK